MSSNGVIYSDYTLMTVARDPQSQRYYYKTYDDQTIRMVDLKAFDLNAKTIRQVSTKSEQPVVNMSEKLKPARGRDQRLKPLTSRWRARRMPGRPAVHHERTAFVSGGHPGV